MFGSPAYHHMVNATPTPASARERLKRQARTVAVDARKKLPKEPGETLGAELEFMAHSNWLGGDDYLARFIQGVELMCRWAVAAEGNAA